MTNLEIILKYLLSNKERYKREYHLTKIGVFGSFSRNEENPNSDIDLIIEFEKDTKNIFDIKYRIKNEIETKFNLNVDICREKYIKPIFKNQILKEAKYV